MKWQHLLLGYVFTSSVTSLSSSRRVLHEKRDFPIAQRRERLAPDALIPIRIGLKQTNLHLGYDKLMEVSHPRSDKYGQHLSAAEVHELFAPTEETVQIVKNWLLNSGISDSNILSFANKGWLALNLPVVQAEQLFSTQYFEYKSEDGSRIGCDAYYLPAHVSKHVDFIKPGVKLSAPLKKRTVNRDTPDQSRLTRPYPPHARLLPWSAPPAAHGLPSNLQSCAVNITPICLRALYDIPAGTLHDPANAMGLFEHYDAFSQQDIDIFFSRFAAWVPQGTIPKVVSVDGGTAPVTASSDRNGGESDLDLDLAYSLIYPQTVTVYQVDDLPNADYQTEKIGFLNTFLDSVDGSYCNYTAFGITGDSPHIDPVYPDTLPGGYDRPLECGTYELTRVVSISYSNSEYYFPKPYVERQCNEIMKLGLQGYSFFVASGDFGVASFPGYGSEFGCLSGNGQNGTIYNPGYPMGCPYITVVGATRLYPNQTVCDPESAMQVNISAFNLQVGSGPTSAPYGFVATGGGFSNFFTTAAYQAKAVSRYLAEYPPDVPSYSINTNAYNITDLIGADRGVYNRAGRGYPDVSANGAYLLASVNLTVSNWFGTSLSSPIFGAVITLINEQRTAAGKAPVGFVNPVLYEHPEVLHDITNGSNPNCGSSGFKTAPGWDPVTGLGTPNYPKMLELFMSLP